MSRQAALKKAPQDAIEYQSLLCSWAPAKARLVEDTRTKSKTASGSSYRLAIWGLAFDAYFTESGRTCIANGFG